MHHTLLHAHTHTHTHIHTQHGLIYPTTQGALFQKYLQTLVQELSPSQESPENPSMHFTKLSHSLSSMKDIPYSLPPPPLPPRRSGSSAVRYSSTAPKESSSGTGFSIDDEDIVEETDLWALSVKWVFSPDSSESYFSLFFPSFSPYQFFFPGLIIKIAIIFSPCDTVLFLWFHSL